PTLFRSAISTRSCPAQAAGRATARAAEAKGVIRRKRVPEASRQAVGATPAEWPVGASAVKGPWVELPPEAMTAPAEKGRAARLRTVMAITIPIADAWTASWSRATWMETAKARASAKPRRVSIAMTE